MAEAGTFGGSGGLDPGTSEISSKALFFSLRCCQPYNPVGIRQPAVSAGYDESAVLGFGQRVAWVGGTQCLGLVSVFQNNASYGNTATV